jgi:hypothetical protein
MSLENKYVEFVPRRIARWANSAEAIVRCTTREYERVHRCVEKVLDTLEILRLLDFFDVMQYVEILRKERIYGESEKVWYDFLKDLESRYPIRIEMEDKDP